VLYDNLLSALRNSGMREAANEFESRFSPLLPAILPSENAVLDSHEEMTDQHDSALERDRIRRNFGGALTVYMAAFFLAFIVAFSAFRMTATERSTVTTAVTIPTAMAAEPVSQITTQPTAVTSAEQNLFHEE
jgi:hypothetical protein